MINIKTIFLIPITIWLILGLLTTSNSFVSCTKANDTLYYKLPDTVLLKGIKSYYQIQIDDSTYNKPNDFPGVNLNDELFNQKYAVIETYFVDSITKLTKYRIFRYNLNTIYGRNTFKVSDTFLLENNVKYTISRAKLLDSNFKTNFCIPTTGATRSNLVTSSNLLNLQLPVLKVTDIISGKYNQINLYFTYVGKYDRINFGKYDSDDFTTQQIYFDTNTAPVY